MWCRSLFSGFQDELSPKMQGDGGLEMGAGFRKFAFSILRFLELLA